MRQVNKNLNGSYVGIADLCASRRKRPLAALF
jgi:hypothetical protein